MQRFRKFLVLIFIFAAVSLQAKEISYNLDVSSPQVNVGEVFQVSLEIINAGNASVTIIETNSAISLREAGKSSNFSFTNGQQSSSVTITYMAKALQEGKQKIGPFRIKNRGNTIDTDPVYINVSQTASTENEMQENKEAFLKTIVSKNSVYEGEFVDISVRFYTSVEARINDYTQLKFPDNAWAEDVRQENENKTRVQIGNRTYDEYEIEHKRIFINTPGNYQISSAKMNLYLFSRTAMFSYYSTPVFLETSPITLEVKQLPETLEKIATPIPTGDFSFYVSMSSMEAKVGEPVTMTITLKGTGNFHVINKFPISYGKEIEVFSSKSNLLKNGNASSGKSWEILLLPKKPGNLKIIVGPFVYFDTNSAVYKKLPEEQCTIISLENENTENQTMQTRDFNNDGMKKKRNDKKINSSSLFLISNVLEKRTSNPSNSLFIFIMAGLYFLFFSITILFILLRYKSRNGKKEINPLKHLEKKLKEIDINNPSKAIEKLYGELETFLINEFSIDSVDIRKNVLKEKMSEQLSQKLLEQLIDCISEFEIIRFGGMEISIENLLRLKEQVVELCKNLNKYKEAK